MPNIFLIADLHLGHKNAVKWRSQFTDIDHHDRVITVNWNSVVRPHDKVYVLGDVTMSPKDLYLVSRLNGDKVLIKGNHDKAKLVEYSVLFRDVRAVHELDGMVLSHVPVHPYCMERWSANIHGHTHDKIIDDPRYYNVSCEQINYTPIPFETIRRHYERGN